MSPFVSHEAAVPIRSPFVSEAAVPIGLSSCPHRTRTIDGSSCPQWTTIGGQSRCPFVWEKLAKESQLSPPDPSPFVSEAGVPIRSPFVSEAAVPIGHGCPHRTRTIGGSSCAQWTTNGRPMDDQWTRVFLGVGGCLEASFPKSRLRACKKMGGERWAGFGSWRVFFQLFIQQFFQALLLIQQIFQSLLFVQQIFQAEVVAST